MGSDDDINYIPLRSLPNFVPFGNHEKYLAQYYPGASIQYLTEPRFWIKTPEINENAEVVPFSIYLPQQLPTIIVNGLRYDPANLRCSQLEVLHESERLEKTNYETTFQVAPLGTFQICKFIFPTMDIAEISLRYKRWDPSRLVAIATTISSDKGLPPLIFVTTTGRLKHAYCVGPRFIP